MAEAPLSSFENPLSDSTNCSQYLHLQCVHGVRQQADRWCSTYLQETASILILPGAKVAHLRRNPPCGICHPKLIFCSLPSPSQTLATRYQGSLRGNFGICHLYYSPQEALVASLATVSYLPKPAKPSPQLYDHAKMNAMISAEE